MMLISRKFTKLTPISGVDSGVESGVSRVDFIRLTWSESSRNCPTHFEHYFKYSYVVTIYSFEKLRPIFSILLRLRWFFAYCFWSPYWKSGYYCYDERQYIIIFHSLNEKLLKFETEEPIHIALDFYTLRVLTVLPTWVLKSL